MTPSNSQDDTSLQSQRVISSSQHVDSFSSQPITQPMEITSDEVIRRIEELIELIIEDLDEDTLPVMETYQEPSGDGLQRTITKRFNLSQCRSFTSIVLVLSFCHSLLASGRTTTTREIYYFYVTHFRSQQECDLAISDAAVLLQVPRHALGLKASPRGWFCGDIQLVRKDTKELILDGRVTHLVHGSPISSEWLVPSSTRPFEVQTERATCILVIEKEGIYTRLLEDSFFDDYPCIMVTGKGFPDLATRALVHTLHNELGLPVWGLADCNPFGVSVLHTYQHTERLGVDGGSRYGVPIQWVGLRPSQVEQLRSGSTALPPAVLQKLTDVDKKRLENSLLKEEHRWTNYGQNEQRVQELTDMLDLGYKVELEALNWLGLDFCADWLGRIFQYNDKSCAEIEEDEEAQEWLEII